MVADIAPAQVIGEEENDVRTLGCPICRFRRLRSKVDDPFPRKLLRTVRGVGYVLEG